MPAPSMKSSIPKVFDALLSKDQRRLDQLCRQRLESCTAPGGFSALHLCALTGDARPVGALAAAGALLDACLEPGWLTPHLRSWLVAHGLERAAGTEHLVAGATPLSLAVGLGHQTTALALVDAGADALQLLLQDQEEEEVPGSCALPTLPLECTSWLLPHLARLFIEGRLPVQGAQQLGSLARLAADCGELGVCLEIARTAASRQLPLRSPVPEFLLLSAVESGHAGLARYLLASGVDVHRAAMGGQPLVLRAAEGGHADVLAELLAAGGGAAVGDALLQVVLRSQQPELLEVLLQRGRLSIDYSQPFFPVPYPWHSGKKWMCPALLLLQTHALKHDRHELCSESAAVRMAELLAAAGHRPTVYWDVVVPPATTPVPEYDPLTERAAEFCLDGCNEYVWLALQAQDWSPAAHPSTHLQ